MMVKSSDRYVELDSNDVDSTAGGALAKLFRLFLSNSGLIPALDYLVDRYLTKERQRRHLDGGSETVKITTKSVLSNNIRSKDMTIKVFIELLSKVIGADKIELSVKVHSKRFTKPIISTVTIACNGDDEDGLLDQEEEKLPRLENIKKDKNDL